MDNKSRIIRLPEVMELTGLKKTYIYQLINEKRFPAQVKLQGSRMSAWRLRDVEAFNENSWGALQ